MKTYNGTLDPKKMTKEQKQGYVSWANQCSKCNNPKNPDFKYYGGKGVRVKYTSREFVGWWLHNLKKKKWIKPTTGRINHDRDYCFDNIEMQEMDDNRQERVNRCGRPKPFKTRPRPTIALLQGRVVGTFKSHLEAAKCLGVACTTVGHLCNGTYRSNARKLTSLKTGLTFKYLEDYRRHG